MQFVIKAYDGENMLEKRMAVRPQHLEGMKKLGRHIVCAGGILDEEGNMKGSALIVDFEDRAALDEYLKNETFVVEHVWEKIEVERVNVVIPKREPSPDFTFIVRSCTARRTRAPATRSSSRAARPCAGRGAASSCRRPHRASA